MLETCIENSCSTRQRVIVIGDVHGASSGFLALLHKSNITISLESCEWRSQQREGTLLVQVGDIVDRGPGALQAWTCLEHLQRTAPVGSNVIRLIG